MAHELYFAYPSDNLLATASSITLSTGTELDAQYELDKLFDGTWYNPFKAVEDTIAIDMEWSSPVSPALAILGNTNITVAATLLGHTDATFGSGFPDITITFGVPSVDPFGFFTSPFQVPSVAAKAHWRLVVSANAYPVIIGELGLYASALGLSRAYNLSSAKRLLGGTVYYETPAKVGLAYEQSTAVRTIDGFFIVQTDAELATVEQLVAKTRFRARPFFLIPRASVDDAWMVRFTLDELQVETYGSGAQRINAPIMMCGRGLAHVDPDTI
jgi:hypothetical protein